MTGCRNTIYKIYLTHIFNFKNIVELITCFFYIYIYLCRRQRCTAQTIGRMRLQFCVNISIMTQASGKKILLKIQPLWEWVKRGKNGKLYFSVIFFQTWHEYINCVLLKTDLVIYGLCKILLNTEESEGPWRCYIIEKKKFLKIKKK